MAYKAKEFDCRKCTQKIKKIRGCEKPTKTPQFIIDDVEYDRCPKKCVEPWAWQILEIFSFYKKGFLPYPNGIMHQPYWLMQAFLVIDEVLMELENADQQRIANRYKGKR